MFYTKKKREELLSHFAKVTQEVNKIEILAHNLFHILSEQAGHTNTSLVDLKTLLTEIKECTSCVKTDVEDVFNRLENVDKSIEHLFAAEYATKLLEVEKFAEEMKRLVKVVDLLNDTIHENILDGATSLDDIT